MGGAFAFLRRCRQHHAPHPGGPCPQPSGSEAGWGRGGLYEQALALHQEIGHQAGVTRVLNNLAWVVFRQGDPNEAEMLYEEALAIARAIERKSAIARGLHNLALLRRNLDDLVSAQGLYQQALALAQEIGDRGMEATCLNNLAWVLRQRGDPGAALETFERALALAREIGDKRGVAGPLNNLGILLRQRGELVRCDDARRVLEGRESLAGVRDLESRLRFELVRAELEARGEGAEAGFAWLEGLLRQSETTGFGELSLEIRLALSIAARDAGRKGEARSRLEALDADATARAFLGLAARAREVEV